MKGKVVITITSDGGNEVEVDATFDPVMTDGPRPMSHHVGYAMLQVGKQLGNMVYEEYDGVPYSGNRGAQA